MTKEKVQFQKEKETLLIPLYCRYLEGKKESPIIIDEKAEEIVERIEYDFSALDIPKQTRVTICLRAKQFDNYTKRFLEAAPNSVFFHLGCGLDSRFFRIDNGGVEWYDLDFPEVIALRKNFYSESARYHMIPSSVANLQWLDEVQAADRPVLILAEGLFMYLKESEIKELFSAFSKRFSRAIIIFDSYSETTVRGIKNHPSIRRTGAVVRWGINNAEDIESWDEALHLTEEWFFTQSEELSKLDGGYRFLFRIMGLFPMARKAHRVLVFEIR